MGSLESEEGRSDDEVQHEVTLTKGFWIQESQVTQELWKAVTGENPSEFTDEPLRPVECVTWNCCRDFIQKLNDGGIVPCGMRLDFPTNAEWEYGCRAGSTSAFSVGGNLTAEDANFNNYIGKTTAVKSYPPNAWGLYDMHGNVEEWTLDWIKDYRRISDTDPVGATDGRLHSVRGGSYYSQAVFCRAAFQFIFPQNGCGNYVGLRLALKSAE